MWSKFKGSRASQVLLSILIAVICWLYVDLAETPDSEVQISNIPVTYTNAEILEEENLLILDESPSITIRVSGPRSVITKLDRDNIVITASAANITSAGVYSLDCVVSLPSSITSASENPVRIVSRSSSAVEVTVVRMVSKDVPIRAEFTGSVADTSKYFYDENSFVLQQNELTISGEESQVNAVSYAKVVLNETNLTETWTGWLNVILCNQDGQVVESDNLSLEVDAISAAFYVESMKEIQLTVGLIAGGGATSENARYTIDPSTITVRGEEILLSSLETLELGKINLGDIIASSEVTLPIKLPDGVSSKDDLTEAKVQVSISGLETRKIAVSKIEVLNAPEGYVFDYAPIEIRVRGKTEDLDVLMEDDIKVTVDLADLEVVEGALLTVPASIEIVGLPEVGVLGSYHVGVTASMQAVE